MGHDTQDEHFVTGEKHSGNQAIVIAGNVEDGTVAHQVGRGERGTDFGKGAPARSSDLRVPTSQGNLRSLVFSPKRTKSFEGDDPHGLHP